MARRPPDDAAGTPGASGKPNGRKPPKGATRARESENGSAPATEPPPAASGPDHDQPSDHASAPPDDGADDIAGELIAEGMPIGFAMGKNGVYAFSEKIGDPPGRICGRLEVIARTRDAEGDDWGKQLRWPDDDGQTKEWAMPLVLLAGDGIAVRERLMRGGLYVGMSRRARESLGRYLMLAKPKARIRIVADLGWHETEHGPAFVLPERTISASDAGATMRLQTEHPEVLPRVAVSGTLEEWKREVAALAVDNSRLMLAIGASFAAPLLSPLGLEGGGYHFVGRSSMGKTRALELGGSVWGGGGKRGWVQSWNLSPTAMEAVAAAHCDLLLALDEISEMQEPRMLGPMAYSLSNGQARGRGRTDGSGQRRRHWRLIFLSSGEATLAQTMAEDPRGRRSTAGQAVRVVDVPADAGNGYGLFQYLHGCASGQHFSDLLKDRCQRFYGTAGPEFLRRIITERDAVIAEVRATRSDFMSKRVPASADGQVRRVADRFALVAAAGSIAAAMGILPFSAELPILAAARCFEDWRMRRGGDGPAEWIAGIAQVRHFLEVHALGRFRRFGVWKFAGDEAQSDATGRERVQLAGFRRQGKGGAEYFVLPEVWRNEVAVGFDPGELAAEMVRRKLIRPDPGDHKPQCRCSLPDRPSGARAYHILPAIFADDASG